MILRLSYLLGTCVGDLLAGLFEEALTSEQNLSLEAQTSDAGLTR